MVNEKEFYEKIQNGDYRCLPKELYDMFILAVSNQDKTTLTVRRSERPTLIEEAVYHYKLQGLKFDVEVDIKDSWSMFTRTFKITMDVAAFLSNLPLFYQASEEELRRKYEMVEKKRHNNWEITIYKRKIKKTKC